MKSNLKKLVLELLKSQPMSLEQKVTVLKRVMNFLKIIDDFENNSFNQITLIKVLGDDYQYILGTLMDVYNPIIYQSFDNHTGLLNFRINESLKNQLTAA